MGGGEGQGQYLNPNYSMYLKKKEEQEQSKKKLTESGLEPTTSGLEKPALLSTRLNTIIAVRKLQYSNSNKKKII